MTELMKNCICGFKVGGFGYQPTYRVISDLEVPHPDSYAALPDAYFIGCPRCSIATEKYKTLAEAIEKWNLIS